MKSERIISIFADKATFEKGSFDVTKKLYEIIPEDDIEAIKYVMPSSTPEGIYFTVVLLDKKEKGKGQVGFKK